MPNRSYRRLLCPERDFPLASAETRRVLEPALIRLGRSLRDIGDPVFADPAVQAKFNDDPNALAPAGYTYLGQFIDHDLSCDPTPLAEAGLVPVEQTNNPQTARLDLSHLYGAGPAGGSDQNENPLYNLGEPLATAHFAVAPTTAGRHRDVPRGPGGEVLTGDGRHEDNVILSQLTAAFLRFHNAVLDRVAAGAFRRPLPTGEQLPQDGTAFTQARRLVTWHYQEIVCGDFLPKVINPEIWREIWGRRAQRDHRFLPDGEEDFQVPVEFVLAAFRYGHSAVLPDYKFNDRLQLQPGAIRRGKVLLEQMMNPGNYLDFSVPGQPPSLRDEWVIDWDGFVEGLGSQTVLSASRIDTRLAPPLFHLPDDPAYPELPVRTLLRGSRVGLPSGQQVAQAFGLTETQILRGKRVTADPDFMAAGFHEETPLFYYILKEAEDLGNPYARRRLGPLGSQLVGGTILAALQADPNSFLRAAPPRWNQWMAVGGRFALAELLTTAGVASFPPPVPGS